MLITGGSGDLGRVLIPALTKRSHRVTVLDTRAPTFPPPPGVEVVLGSITDRETVESAVRASDAIIHVAALHGIHEFRKTHDEYAFWDVNVTGTFNLLEAASRTGVRRFLFISSTSVDEWPHLYGSSKVMAEEIARTYSARHEMNVVTLRPRAFIPHWNKEVYSSYVEWAQWFWGGAVHIADVARATLSGLDYVNSEDRRPYHALTIDGAYDYSDDDLRDWDKEGRGTTFLKYYSPYLPIVRRYDLDPAKKPKKRPHPQAGVILGYSPQFSLLHLLQELERFGSEGPPEEEVNSLISTL